MLTKAILNSLAPGETIATGITHDERLWKNPVRWIAVRGEEIPDWAIYYHHQEHSVDYVSKSGDKVFSEEVIKKLVPCDEEAFKMYRRF